MVKSINIKENQNKFFYRKFLNYYGLSLSQAKVIAKLFGLNIKNGSISGLSESEIILMEQFVRRNYLIETALKSEVIKIIRLFISIKSYRGSRHTHRLPANGQRSKQNGKTVAKMSTLSLNTLESKDIYKLLI